MLRCEKRQKLFDTVITGAKWDTFTLLHPAGRRTVMIKVLLWLAEHPGRVHRWRPIRRSRAPFIIMTKLCEIMESLWQKLTCWDFQLWRLNQQRISLKEKKKWGEKKCHGVELSALSGNKRKLYSNRKLYTIELFDFQMNLDRLLKIWKMN